jgi:hypothetical protein
MKIRKLTKKEALKYAKDNLARMSLKKISKYTGWSIATFSRAGIRASDAVESVEIPKEIQYKSKLVYIPEWRAVVKLHANTTVAEYMKKVQKTRDKHLFNKV